MLKTTFWGAHILVIVDDILFDMSICLSWPEITGKYRSKSQIYEAYRIFSEEMADNFQKPKDDLVKVRMDLEEAETCRDQVVQEKKLVINEVEALGAENQRLKNYVSNKKRLLDLKREQVI
jgi:hypothetical protein